jgi:hypothetical protein
VSEQIDTSTPTGKMVFTVLGAVAELKRSLIAERVRAGIRNARAKGKRMGRPRVTTDASRICRPTRPVRPDCLSLDLLVVYRCMSSPHTPLLFVSYAHSDSRDIALRLYEDLVNERCEVWLDHARLPGQATWTRDIEIALKRSDVVLALLSQGSYRSDYCRAEQIVALRSGKCLIPLIVQSDTDIPLHIETKRYFDLSDSSRYREEIRAALTAVAARNGALLPECFLDTLVSAPELREGYVDRPEALEGLQSALRGALFSQAMTHETTLTAFVGPGGVGKTVLATTICHDAFFQAAFPDGILWLTFGQQPRDIRELMWEVVCFWGNAREWDANLQYSEALLRSTLHERAALLVFDDVWDASHVLPFLPGGPRCRFLVTTRNHRVADQLMAQKMSIDVFARVSSGNSDPLNSRNSEPSGKSRKG